MKNNRKRIPMKSFESADKTSKDNDADKSGTVS